MNSLGLEIVYRKNSSTLMIKPPTNPKTKATDVKRILSEVFDKEFLVRDSYHWTKGYHIFVHGITEDEYALLMLRLA